MSATKTACRHVRPAAGVRLAGRWLGPAVLFLLFLTGCRPDNRQSTLHPAGPAAAEIAVIWWVMFVVLSAVFVLVIVLTLAAVRRSAPKDARPPGGPIGFVIGGGIIMPAVILVALLFYSLHVTLSLRRPDEGVLIQVTGYQWWWDVRYPDYGIVTANELYIPADEPVLLELMSADVVHSFWVPSLHGKMDAVPETVNRFWIRADKPGMWRGQCAEFCGRQHALMAFEVVALPREEFDEWAAARRRPPPVPATPEVVAGEEVFNRKGCNTCHGVRGVRAEEAGPDLSHIGSRLTLGAGTIENNPGNLAGWITNPQTIKPGNEMPRTFLDADELKALVAYLQSLK